MPSGNLKRSSSQCGETRFERANTSQATTDRQTRSKKQKTKSSEDATEQARQSMEPEKMIEPADGDAEDFEDDPSAWNPIASQLNRALEQVKKPDHWPRDFAKRVRERQTALLEELKLKSHTIVAGRQQFISQFHNVIAAALAPVGTEFPSAARPLQVTHVTATGQPLHGRSCVLLEESKNLIAHYDQLAQQHSDISRLEDLAKEFAADKDRVAQAISAGRRVADADIDDMLADGLHELRGRKAITADDETLGREILQIGQNQRPDLPPLDTETWGKIAYRAQRAVEKLYNVAVTGE